MEPRWRLDADFPFDNGVRIVQFTPPGSRAQSNSARTDVGRPGVGAEPVPGCLRHRGGARRARRTWSRGQRRFHPGAPGAQFQPDVRRSDQGARARPRHLRLFATFSDPDGNRWLLQEVTPSCRPRRPSATSFGSAADLEAALMRAATAHGEQRSGWAANTTRTGRPGTPRTWWRSRPGRDCRREHKQRDTKGSP